jgi:hypothetical protein
MSTFRCGRLLNLVCVSLLSLQLQNISIEMLRSLVHNNKMSENVRINNLKCYLFWVTK